MKSRDPDQLVIVLVLKSLYSMDPDLRWAMKPKIQVTRSPVLMWAIDIEQEHSSSSNCDLENLRDEKAQSLLGTSKV